MTNAKIIEHKVNSLKEDVIFSISDLGFPADWWENVRVKLARLAEKGTIMKVGKGRYYKPRKSMFGTIPPDREELVKDLLYDDSGKLEGYLTGYSVWNELGLTTQIPHVIEIGSRKRRNSLKRGLYRVDFINQPNRITKANVFMLQVLDAIKYIKKIPDATVSDSLFRLKAIISDFYGRQLVKFVKLALNYPPRVRAIVGAILEELGHQSLADSISVKQNPSTKYDFGAIDDGVLSNKSKWNII